MSDEVNNILSNGNMIVNLRELNLCVNNLILIFLILIINDNDNVHW